MGSKWPENKKASQRLSQRRVEPRTEVSRAGQRRWERTIRILNPGPHLYGQSGSQRTSRWGRWKGTLGHIPGPGRRTLWVPQRSGASQEKRTSSQAPLTGNGEVGGCVGELQASLLQGCHVQEQTFPLGIQVIPHQGDLTAVQVVHDLV